MKLSRRGKYAMHTRRGKHTKRAGKKYSRRIKYHSKQYKRTYRKNKKRTRCRSLRGGSPQWTASVVISMNNVMLKYKKRGLVAQTKTDTYEVTLQKEVKPNDNTLPIKYIITLTRITRKPNIQFVINIIPSDTWQFAIQSYDTQKNADPETAAATEAATAAAEVAAENSWNAYDKRQLKAEQDRTAQAAAVQDTARDTAKTGVNYTGGSNDTKQLSIGFIIDYDGKTPDKKLNTSAFTYASNSTIYAVVYASLFNIQSDRKEGYDFDNDNNYQVFMEKILEAIVRDGPSSFNYNSEGNTTSIKTTRDYDDPPPYKQYKQELRHTTVDRPEVEQPQQPQLQTRTTV